jgi:hypothetical protein
LSNTVTYTTNLKLRLDSNLTANSRYNLERLDTLAGTYVIDSTDLLRIRSRGDILIVPESADMGGAGTGGTITIGDSNSPIANLTINALNTNLTTALNLLDQATGGTKYLKLKYNSTVSGSVDTVADRSLTIDLSGADRSLLLGGNVSVAGGSLALSLSGDSALTLPSTGTLSTQAGIETLTNKTISGLSNTITDLTNNAVSNTAAISYTKLNLANSITNSDIVSAAGISGSKVSPDFGNQTIKTQSYLQFQSTYNTNLRPAQTGQATDLTFTLPFSAGNSGQVLATDGSGNLSWQSAAGTGSVTSIALSMPSLFSVAGSPITTNGTFAVTQVDQSANTILAGPDSGIPGAPSYRSLVLADLPATVISGITDTNSIALVNTAGNLTANVRLANSTLLTNGSGLQVNTGGISNNEINSSASIGLSKLAALAVSKALVSDASGVITASGVSGTTLAYLDATSSVQTQLNAKQASSTELTGLAALASNGFVARTTTGTYAARTLSAGSSKLTVTNGDGVSGSPSVDLVLANVDHNSLLNYVANQHIDHSSVSISTSVTSGLSGGGTIASSRALVIDPTLATLKSVPDSADVLLVADSAASNALKKVSISSILALGGGSYSTDWTSLTSKTVTHNLGSRDVLVQLYDNTTFEAVMVDSVVRTDTNTVTLTASQAASGSGWRVLVKKL